MNKILWKLHIAGERMWLLANMIAQQSSVMGVDGKGIAVVAEETRIIANKINEMVERALNNDEEINHEKIQDIAFHMNLLALNSAVECSWLGTRGQPVVVCTEDIRTIAYNLSLLSGDEKNNLYYGFAPMSKESYAATPMPKDVVKSSNHNNEFILLEIAGVQIVEPIRNIDEICVHLERKGNHINLRGIEYPVIDCYKMLGKSQSIPTYVITKTPWAEQNKKYAIVADALGLFYSPTCLSATAPADTPLVEYIREYWESENDIPYIFMDWAKLAK
ncbi:MAG: hypothetical protein LBC73_00875 [Oscillospiraceae bacterium]|nr:hypothetical protein [Oscillospiraceae bacterium]